MTPGRSFSFACSDMTYHVLLPAYPVNLVVDHFIIMKGRGLPGYERLFPNNKTEIFFNFGDTVKGCGEDDQLAIRENIVSGVKQRFFDFYPPTHYFMAGLRFTLFGFKQLFNIPSCLFTDNSFPVNDVLGKDIRFMQEQLFEATDHNTIFSILTEWIMSYLSKASFTEINIWRRLERKIHDPNLSIAALLDDEMGYSRKHAIKLFKNHAGLSPKEVQKVIRFDKTLKKISQVPIKSWAGFAYECGYADQSHLIREFKNFSGYTPVEYVQLKPHEYFFYENLPDGL